jgi:hypothetical protein
MTSDISNVTAQDLRNASIQDFLSYLNGREQFAYGTETFKKRMTVELTNEIKVFTSKKKKKTRGCVNITRIRASHPSNK